MTETKHASYQLSIAANFHDSSFALLNTDTNDAHVVEIERVTGLKHDRAHKDTMRLAVQMEMARLGILPDQLTGVLLAELNHEPQLTEGGVAIAGRNFKPEMFSHHEGHIGTMLPLGIDHAVVIVADGGSEMGTTHVWLKNGDQITHLDDLSDTFFNGRPYGNLTAMVYQAAKISRAHDTLPGKFMGLAGTGKFDEKIWKLLEQHQEELNQLYLDRTEIDKLIDMFGIRDQSGQQKDPQKDPYNVAVLRDFAYTANLYWVTKAMEQIQKYQGISKNVVIVGGCALNVDLNTAVHDKGWFEAVHNVPNSNDSGQAIGGLLYHNRAAARKLVYPYIGRKFIGPDHKYGIYQIEGTPGELVGQVVTDLLAGEIVAWYDGAEENGSRALLHRSLIGLPSNNEMKHLISVKFKKREPWRPVAPVVIEEELEKWFDTTQKSPFMTTAPKAKVETKKRCPAIIHHDGTARIQTLKETDNPIMHAIIKALKDYGLPPIIMNTSFNVAEETIVSDPMNAIRQAKKWE